MEQIAHRRRHDLREWVWDVSNELRLLVRVTCSIQLLEQNPQLRVCDERNDLLWVRCKAVASARLRYLLLQVPMVVCLGQLVRRADEHGNNVREPGDADSGAVPLANQQQSFLWAQKFGSEQKVVVRRFGPQEIACCDSKHPQARQKAQLHRDGGRPCAHHDGKRPKVAEHLLGFN